MFYVLAPHLFLLQMSRIVGQRRVRGRREPCNRRSWRPENRSTALELRVDFWRPRHRLLIAL